MRTIHPDTLAAISVDGFHPVLMVHVDWPDGAVYAHSGFGNISFNGQTWGGTGPFSAVDIPDEEIGTAVPAEASLSILGDIEAIQQDMEQDARNRDVDIYVGTVSDAQGNVLIGEPWPLMVGYVDSNDLEYQEIEEGVMVPSFSLGVNTGPSVRMALSATHSSEDQQKTYPTDTIFRHTVYSETEKVNPPIFP